MTKDTSTPTNYCINCNQKIQDCYCGRDMNKLIASKDKEITELSYKLKCLMNYREADVKTIAELKEELSKWKQGVFNLQLKSEALQYELSQAKQQTAQELISKVKDLLINCQNIDNEVTSILIEDLTELKSKYLKGEKE